MPFAVLDRFHDPDPVPTSSPKQPSLPAAPADTFAVEEDPFYYRYEEDSLPVLAFPDTLPYEDLVLRELGGLDASVTPGEWRERYPDDALERFAEGSGELGDPFDPFLGPVCARAQRGIPLTDGGAALRLAIFYPPPNEGAGLPVVRDSLGLDLSECRMGAVWLTSKIEAPPLWRSAPADSARIRGRFERMRSAFHGEFGPPDQSGPPFLPYRFWDWLPPSFWHDDGTSRLIFYDDFYNDLQVGAWTDLSALPIEPATAERALAATLLPDLRRLVQWAALDSGRADSLLTVASHIYLAHRHVTDEVVSETDFASPLGDWLRDSDSLPFPRRAAALLVADRTLSLVLPSVDTREAGRAGPFEALGAEYDFNEIGGSYDYTGNWLDAAYETAVPGPVQDLAFLVLLRRAFVAPTCNHLEDAFRKVIEEGERFLEERPDSWFAPEVALEVARAHGDVVALAWEIDDVASSYVEGELFRAEAPSARRAALRYYRTAQAGLEDSVLVDAAWREAWRLAAGMPPVATSHVHICD